MILGLGRSLGVGNGNPIQYSCLENSMDRGAWQATFHGAAKSCTQLNDWAHTINYNYWLIYSRGIQIQYVSSYCLSLKHVLNIAPILFKITIINLQNHYCLTTIRLLIYIKYELYDSCYGNVIALWWTTYICHIYFIHNI